MQIPMPTTTTQKERHFWQAAVRHMSYLHEIGHSSGTGFFGNQYAKLAEKTKSFRAEFRQDWDGTSYEKFKELEERRRSFHEKERSLHLRQLWQKALALAQGEPMGRLSLADVDDAIVREILCKAIHDTSTSQVQDLLQMEDGSEEDLEVYALAPGEIEELGRRALEAARHGIALDVIDEVGRYVEGHDIYEADPKTVLSSPSEIAKTVQAEHAEKPRAERVDLAWQEYELAPNYNGKTDERGVRKALNQAFSRREQ